MALVSIFKKDPEAQLMLAYARGDADAFETLYLNYKDELYRFFLRQCGNQALAEELFQDVWVRVINARQSYAVKAKFRTWLYRIAHNILVDHYRKPVEEDPLDDEQLIPASRTDNPETIISGQEKLARYRSMIRALPDEQREVFLLKEESGMSLADIAGITGENTETIKSRLRYAVAKLKQALNPLDEEPDDNAKRQRSQSH